MLYQLTHPAAQLAEWNARLIAELIQLINIGDQLTCMVNCVQSIVFEIAGCFWSFSHDVHVHVIYEGSIINHSVWISALVCLRVV